MDKIGNILGLYKWPKLTPKEIGNMKWLITLEGIL